MNWSLTHFLVHSPWWFVAMWVVLIALSLVLVWQSTKEDR